jgi:YD repeat-containing protein
VEFSLVGATAAPARTGVPEALRGRSEASARSAATYAGALPGVDVAYTALPEGVKEELVLAGPDAPTTYDFRVALSPGLAAQETAEGGIAIVGAQGTERVRFAAPFVVDASQSGEGLADGPGYSTEAVTLRIVASAPELVVRLAVDPAWLAAPERAWPVVVDPTVTLTGSTKDTYLGSGAYANNNYSSSTVMGIGGGTTRIRTLQQRNMLSFFNEPAVVTGASLQLYVTNDTSASAQRHVAVHEVTSSWAGPQATWNNRLTGTPWSSAGGDFDPLPLWRGNGIIGAPGWRSLPITRVLQNWVDGMKPGNGVVVKYLDESAGPQVVFASAEATDTTKRPRMVVNWEPVQGLRDIYGYEDFDLGGTRRARVNLASGNLTVSEADLNIAGSGLDPLVQRFYNSRSPYQGSMGSRWVMWPQSKERLYEGSAEDVFWRGGPAERLVFSATGRYDGTLTVPRDYPATMSVVNPGLRYELAHTNGIRNRFYASGYPDQIIDAGGNTITFGYVTNAAGENEMTSMTDSQVGVVSFERSAPNKVVRMVDPAGRSHRYGYSTDSFGNVVLATYTDPAGKITRYGYEGRAVLKTLTAPDGTVTTFGSDADQRLTSLTRNGETWTFDYTTPWRTTVTDPQGNATTHRFDRRGRITSSSGPPYAPTNVRAVPGDAQSALSWAAATANGSAVTGYTITASPGGATKTVAGDVTSTMFDGLTNDTAYTFTAVATNAIGDSVRSATSNEVTPRSDSSLLAPLVAPTNVVASRGDTQAQVSWAEPTLTLPLLTTYEVTTHRAADGAELGTTPAGTDSSVTVTGLKNGTPVYFTVTARSLLISATSEPSNTITPAGPPFAPTDVFAARGDRQVEVSWQPPGPRPDGTPGDNGDPITSYTVTAFRGDDNTEVRTIENAVSPLVVDGLTNGTEYYFTVRATNGVGTGPDSLLSNYVTPAGRPAAPTDVGAMARYSDARVRWATPDDNGSRITGYTVIVSDGRRQTVPASVNSFNATTIVNLEDGVIYEFTVVATNDVSDSEPSAASNGVVATKEPGQPGNVNASASVGNATVTWTPAEPNGAPVLHYTIRADSGQVVTAPGGATSATFTDLAPGSSHYFFVTAMNFVGDGQTVVSNTVKIPENPGSPFDVSAVAIQEGAEVSWTAPSSGGSPITSYTVTASPGAAEKDVPNDFAAGEVPSTTFQPLDPTTTYTFTVVATNEVGDSVTSEPSKPVRPLTEREALRKRADGYMTAPLDDFLVAKNQAPGPFEWSDNGCSFPFPYPTRPQFLEPCQRHDFGYRNYGHGLSLADDEDTRHWIDDRLLLDMLRTCDGDDFCIDAANDTYIGVRLLSGFFY